MRHNKIDEIHTFEFKMTANFIKNSILKFILQFYKSALILRLLCNTDSKTGGKGFVERKFSSCLLV